MINKRRIFFLAITGSLIGLMALSWAFPVLGRSITTTYRTVTGPVYRSASFTIDKAIALGDFLFGSRQMRAEHKKFRGENILLSEKVAELETVVGREEFLKKEYEILKKTEYVVQPAYVTSQDPGGFFFDFTIDRGENSGVKLGDVVVAGEMYTEANFIEGLIGVVEEVGPNWARVVSTLNEETNISFLNSRNLEYGILNGREDRGMFGYVFQTNSDIRVGDKLLTSGLGGVYPKGIYIGEVIDVNVNEELIAHIIVDPVVDFSRLYRVLVIDKEAGLE